MQGMRAPETTKAAALGEGDRRGAGTGYSPFHTGARFSAKAAAPSIAS